MKNTLTRQPLGTTLVLFTLLVGLFWARHLLAPLSAEAAVGNTMPLGAPVQRWLHGVWTEAAVSLAIIYMTVISLTRLVSRNLVFQAKTHTFLILFSVAGFGLCIRSGNVPALAAMWLLSRGSEYMASSFRRVSRAGDLFGGGLCFGLAPLFYAPAVIFLVMVLLSMAVYLRGRRETVLALAGAALPALACSYIGWAAGGPFGGFFGDLGDAVMARGTWEAAIPRLSGTVTDAAGWLRLAAAAMLAVTTLLSLGSFVRDARKLRTRAYRIHLYMICFLAVAAVGMALPCASAGDLPMVALPVSVVAASWFSRYEGALATVVYLLTLFPAVAANVVPYV